jgi:hypothetical protein
VRPQDRVKKTAISVLGTVRHEIGKLSDTPNADVAETLNLKKPAGVGGKAVRNVQKMFNKVGSSTCPLLLSSK